MTRRFWIAVGVAMSIPATMARSETGLWQPEVGHHQQLLWPTGRIPDPSPANGPEKVDGAPGDMVVRDVVDPTMTVYPPTGRNTGAAVLVFPGGGYKILAIDLEGTEICNWLTATGITCVLVKYRVPESGPFWDEGCHCHIIPKAPRALEDAQRALRLIRRDAATWQIDPHKIGVMGFSAGGHVVAAISTHFQDPSYIPVDAADRESARPDFAIAIYPGHLSMAEGTVLLNPDIANHISPQTPPTFLLQNEDDHVDRVEDALSYFVGLKKANVPVELHCYAQGGHAFGLREKSLPVAGWPHLVEIWLRGQGIAAGG